MATKSFHNLLLLSGFLILFTSCVKDVDLGQDDEFYVSPDIAIDLADFIFTSEFFPQDGELPITTRKDTLQLTMLDPDLINELDSVQFRFSYENSFLRSFTNSYVFYSDTYEPLHEIKDLQIEAARGDTPARQDTTVVVKGATMDRLKTAAHLEITLSIGDENTPANGVLLANIIAIYNFSEFEL